MYLLIVVEHRVAGRTVGEDGCEVMEDVVEGETVGEEFGNHLTVGNEIDERDETALDDMVEAPAEETGQRCLVAHHLRDVEEGRLEGCRAACDESGGGMGEERISAVHDYRDEVRGMKRRHLINIYMLWDGWCSGDDELVSVVVLALHLTGYAEHHRQVVVDLLHATAGEEGDDGLPGIETVLAAETVEGL